jgi:hypothetical protein
MSTWSELSNELSSTVQGVGKSIVALQAEGNRTVSGIVLDERTIVTTASVISDGEKIRVSEANAPPGGSRVVPGCDLPKETFNGRSWGPLTRLRRDCNSIRNGEVRTGTPPGI